VKAFRIFFLLTLIGSVFLTSCSEYDSHYDYIVDDISIIADDYYRGGKCELEIIPVRQLHSEFLGGDMMTCDYVCVIPGQGIKGDIEGVLEIYNPENTSWEAQDFDCVIVEYARFGWGEQEILLDGQSVVFDNITYNGDFKGYLTWHYCFREKDGH